jgi:hypothetical protein
MSASVLPSTPSMPRRPQVDHNTAQRCKGGPDSLQRLNKQVALAATNDALPTVRATASQQRHASCANVRASDFDSRGAWRPRCLAHAPLLRAPRPATPRAAPAAPPRAGRAPALPAAARLPPPALPRSAPGMSSPRSTHAAAGSGGCASTARFRGAATAGAGALAGRALREMQRGAHAQWAAASAASRGAPGRSRPGGPQVLRPSCPRGGARFRGAVRREGRGLGSHRGQVTPRQGRRAPGPAAARRRPAQKLSNVSHSNTWRHGSAAPTAGARRAGAPAGRARAGRARPRAGRGGRASASAARGVALACDG